MRALCLPTIPEATARRTCPGKGSPWTDSKFLRHGLGAWRWLKLRPGAGQKAVWVPFVLVDFDTVEASNLAQ